MSPLIEIRWAELTQIRREQWLRQNKVCPVLKCRIEYKDAVLDHKHKLKSEAPGIDGKGLLRGVVHRQVNAIEGKIVNFYRRYGLNKEIDLPTLLRNLANYLENPPMSSIRLMHPSARDVPKKLTRREYNKICKYYFQLFPKRKKLPAYPKSGKMTKEFDFLLKRIQKYLEKQK